MKLLHSVGADFNSTYRPDQPLVSRAARNGHKAVVELLLESMDGFDQQQLW